MKNHILVFLALVASAFAVDIPYNIPANSSAIIKLDAVVGTAPFSYQWKKGGVNIAGANSDTYAIQNVQASDAGSYSITVSNSAGSTVSNNVVLIITAPVTPPPVVTPPSTVVPPSGAQASARYTVPTK